MPCVQCEITCVFDVYLVSYHMPDVIMSGMTAGACNDWFYK